MKIDNFTSKMAFLQKLYGKIDDQIHKTYWEMLKGYSDEVFNLMVEKIVESFIPTSTVKFPLPPHFLESVGLSGKKRTQAAIDVVKRYQHIGPYSSVSFGDRSLHETILRFGGWPVVCDWKLKDWECNERRFAACYESGLSYGGGPAYLTGLREENNSENNHLFNETQKKHALEQSSIAVIVWIGFDDKIELPPPEEMLKIDNKSIGNIGEIDFKNTFNIDQ